MMSWTVLLVKYVEMQVGDVVAHDELKDLLNLRGDKFPLFTISKQ